MRASLNLPKFLSLHNILLNYKINLQTQLFFTTCRNVKLWMMEINEMLVGESIWKPTTCNLSLQQIVKKVVGKIMFLAFIIIIIIIIIIINKYIGLLLLHFQNRYRSLPYFKNSIKIGLYIYIYIWSFVALSDIPNYIYKIVG